MRKRFLLLVLAVSGFKFSGFAMHEEALSSVQKEALINSLRFITYAANQESARLRQQIEDEAADGRDRVEELPSDDDEAASSSSSAYYTETDLNLDTKDWSLSELMNYICFLDKKAEKITEMLGNEREMEEDVRGSWGQELLKIEDLKNRILAEMAQFEGQQFMPPPAAVAYFPEEEDAFKKRMNAESSLSEVSEGDYVSKLPPVALATIADSVATASAEKALTFAELLKKHGRPKNIISAEAASELRVQGAIVDGKAAGTKEQAIRAKRKIMELVHDHTYSLYSWLIPLPCPISKPAWLKREEFIKAELERAKLHPVDKPKLPAFSALADFRDEEEPSAQDQAMRSYYQAMHDAQSTLDAVKRNIPDLFYDPMVKKVLSAHEVAQAKLDKMKEVIEYADVSKRSEINRLVHEMITANTMYAQCTEEQAKDAYNESLITMQSVLTQAKYNTNRKDAESKKMRQQIQVAQDMLNGVRGSDLGNVKAEVLLRLTKLVKDVENSMQAYLDKHKLKQGSSAVSATDDVGNVMLHEIIDPLNLKEEVAQVEEAVTVAVDDFFWSKFKAAAEGVNRVFIDHSHDLALIYNVNLSFAFCMIGMQLITESKSLFDIVMIFPLARLFSGAYAYSALMSHLLFSNLCPNFAVRVMYYLTGLYWLYELNAKPNAEQAMLSGVAGLAASTMFNWHRKLDEVNAKRDGRVIGSVLGAVSGLYWIYLAVSSYLTYVPEDPVDTSANLDLQNQELVEKIIAQHEANLRRMLPVEEIEEAVKAVKAYLITSASINDVRPAVE